jgi:uncharacterized protein YxeA
MKKIILIIALAIGTTAAAQNAKIDASGNYVAIKAQKKDTSTGKTFTDAKGNVWPVYRTSTGRLVIIRTSKDGKEYKQYLKVATY